jgi:hypothetical protein
MNIKLVVLGLAGLLSAAGSLHAQPYYITGSAMTPAWTPGAAGNQLTGNPLTFTSATSVNAYHEFKVTGATWGDPNYPGNNVKIKGDANGSNTFYFYPGTTVDGWSPLNNRVGYADPGNMSFEIIGAFSSSSWNTGIPLNNLGGGIFSNSIAVATAGTFEFKFRTPGTWSEVAFGSDFGNFGNNGSFTTANNNMTVPVVLDLPKGRWLIGTLAPPPVTNQVVFTVDMSSQIQLGKFDPSVDGVFVSGAFNGWPGTGTGALGLTNFPAYNGGSNTNIYYNTRPVVFVGSSGSSPSAYKFTCNNPANSGSSGYEPRGSDRTFNLLSSNGPLALAVVNFGDTISSDYLTANTTVTFTVNMTNAVAGVAPFSVFNPSGNNVYITGNFDDNGWAPSPWSPANLRQMTENPPGSQIYTYTHTVLAGHPVDIHYKYGFDDGANPFDNEAPAYQDHVRVIRTPASGSYTLPTDTFGTQYVEPSFGKLTVTPAAGGNVTVKWVGRPGVKLQTSGNITGSWASQNATDGSTWTGSSAATSDGTATVTNLPASGSAGYFRLVKPN